MVWRYPCAWGILRDCALRAPSAAAMRHFAAEVLRCACSDCGLGNRRGADWLRAAWMLLRKGMPLVVVRSASERPIEARASAADILCSGRLMCSRDRCPHVPLEEA